MNIIDDSIRPDPFNPQPGDVYEDSEGRIVVTGIDPATEFSNEGVNLEINGEQKRRDRVHFPHFLASLYACEGIGRVRACAEV